MKISELANDRATVPVKYRGHTANVTYRPSKYTLGSMDGMIVDKVAELVDSWDVTGDDDQPLPVTPEVMNSLPGGFVLAMWETITADARQADLPEVPGSSDAS